MEVAMSDPTPILLSEAMLNWIHFQPGIVDAHEMSYQDPSLRIAQTVLIADQSRFLWNIAVFFKDMASYWAAGYPFRPVCPPSVLALAEAAFERAGFGGEAYALYYPEDLAEYYNPFEGVQLVVVDTVLHFALHAWERLVLRFLKTAVQSAELSHHDIRNHAQWPTFLQQIDAIEQRIIDEEKNTPLRESTPQNL